jgi:PEP-CTERM motif
VRTRRRFGTVVFGLAALALFGVAQQAQANVIDFNTLGGNTGDAFATYTEGTFTAASSKGNWFVSQSFGNPIPSIFAGPIGSPAADSQITVTGNGTFTFSSVDVSSNNAASNYELQGFLNGKLVFDQTGAVPEGFPVAGFDTIANAAAGNVVDRVLIDLFPTGGPSSINLDNIVVTPAAPPPPPTVPEPSSLALLSLGGLTLAGWRRWRKRTAA